MLNKNFIQMIANELSEDLDLCVWGNNITEGIIRSTIESSILFLGYLKPNRRTSSIIFVDNINQDFLFNIKSTYLNDGNQNTYILSMSFEEENEDDEDIYYFTDIPELMNFIKIYARDNYNIFYSQISKYETFAEQDRAQIEFYMIPIIFTCIYNYVNNPALSNGILEVKDCVTFKQSMGFIKVKFSSNVKQLFKSDKFSEILNK